jgi:hypothetical protein
MPTTSYECLTAPRGSAGLLAACASTAALTHRLCRGGPMSFYEATTAYGTCRYLFGQF